MSKSEYLNDEQKKSVEEFYQKYERLIYKTAHLVKSKCPNLELEDIVQEFLYRISKAAMHFDFSRETTQSTFYYVVMNNEVTSIIRKYYAMSNRANISLISFDPWNEGDPFTSYIEFASEVNETYLNPDALYCESLALEKINHTINSFSMKERIVFTQISDGKSVKQIAQQLNCTEKTIYNMIVKIKKKIKEQIM